MKTYLTGARVLDVWLAGLLLLTTTGAALGAETLEDFGYRRIGTNNAAAGNHPMLIILANFPDPSPPFLYDGNPTYFSNRVFEVNPSKRTANGYFKEVSNNRFQWTPAGLLRVALPESLRYEHVTNDSRYAANIISAAVEANGFDWDSYNTDPSNPDITRIELAITIFSNDRGLSARGVSDVKPPNVSRAYSGLVYVGAHTDGFDVMCHEMSHLIGALDFYGIWGTGCPNDHLTLMGCSYGNEYYHLDAWHKMQLGWSEPRFYPMNSSGSISIPAAQRGLPDAPVILYDLNRGTEEFFLLEYRTRTLTGTNGGYDVDVAGNGLVIWHAYHNANRDPLLVAEVSWPDAERGWRQCTKCATLIYGTSEEVGTCPEGGGHTPHKDDHGLIRNDPSEPGQPDWRYCTKCRCLFFGPNQAASVCPKDGQTHSPSSSNYTLPTDSTLLAHHYWRRCTQCESLFLAWIKGEPQPMASNGVCPAGGAHNSDLTVEYTLPAFWAIRTVQAEGSPDLFKTGNVPWPSDSTTPWLYWYDQTPVSVALRVHPFTTGDDAITVSWTSEIGAWVDFNYSGAEDGSFTFPYNTVAEGVNAVPWHGFLQIKSGTSSETPHITKAVRIRSYNGPVVIGR